MGKKKLTERNGTRIYIEIYKSQSPGAKVRISAIFEIAMMSPPSGFSPFAEGLLLSPVYRFPHRLASSRVSSTLRLLPPSR
jgi:hypothetical protein